MSAFHRDQPYDGLPLLPPQTELETKAVLKRTVAAHRALADLRGMAARIPNQAILINGIVLQEARLSSEIENIVTTHDELFRAAADPDAKADPAAKEVLRYREALWAGFEQLRNRPLTTNLFIELARIIKGVDLDVRAGPGTRLINPSTGQVIYTPPQGQTLLRDKLANLERFLYPETPDDLDPLVRMAVMHYQFEAIHPFVDGNGRTGRILNILWLVEQGLLDIPVLYLSRYILSNRTAYYDGLRGVTEDSAWESWVLYMLDAVEQTARETCDRVRRILELMEATRSQVQQSAPRIYSKDLVELIFRHPYCKIQFLLDAGLAKRQTASVYLRTLSDLGLLKPLKVGREVYYLNEGLLAELVRT
ncbi:Fic/DOC family N-terminal domain-containing protein [Tibeticola sp.]|uniref:Fic family protein n=1 Tax=Tibeticola sp. TaxID=2005368 RepID=UPI0025EF7DF1|nr:Fic/DOC family N-terminal domain-containing protein [Tibeticola sp.]